MSPTPDFWQDRRVFVTGCTGLVGSWTVRALLQRGAHVVGLVRDQVPGCELMRGGNYDKIDIVRGDVTDQPLLERALAEYEIQTVFHLAAQTIVGIANRNPISTFESNIQGTWAVLEACRRSPAVKQIVVASSDKAYGVHDKLPYDEDSALQGQFPYDVSKSCADLIANCYAKTYSLPVCITRCGNFYGGGDLNWNRIVPGTIRSILNGERPIVRSDGTYIRDYFYVADGARAYMTLAERMMERPNLKGEAFNFSNEIQVTVLELVKRIGAAMGSSLEPVILGQGSNEIPHQYLSAAKARRMLQWSPLFDLDSGLAETIRWYREYLQPQREGQRA